MTALLVASPASDLLTGANLPFLASFALALLFTLLSVLGLGHTDMEADGSADLDHDVDVDHDVDQDHGVDLDASAHFDGDFDHDAELDVGDGDLAEATADVDHLAVEPHAPFITLSDVLYFFGIGKVPLSILIMSFGYAFGLVGWLVNTVVSGMGGDAADWFGISLTVAMIAGLFAMRLVSRVIVRVLPTENISGFTRRQLVGLRGIVGLPVDAACGRAQVIDAEGTLHQVRCRTVPGGEALPKGSRIIVVKYVPRDDLYYVAADRKR